MANVLENEVDIVVVRKKTNIQRISQMISQELQGIEKVLRVKQTPAGAQDDGTGWPELCSLNCDSHGNNLETKLIL